MVQLICTMLYLSVVVFEIDLVIIIIWNSWSIDDYLLKIYTLFQQHAHINFGICMLVFASSIGISILLCFCYFGKLVTEDYQQMANCVYESNWINLPIEQQKHLVLIIQNAQQPILYLGLGIAVLELETFCKVTIETESEKESIILFNCLSWYATYFFSDAQSNLYLLHDVWNHYNWLNSAKRSIRSNFERFAERLIKFLQ